jgi:3-phenylpropionate/cinnamic acid dioxygenase small subunit
MALKHAAKVDKRNPKTSPKEQPMTVITPQILTDFVYEEANLLDEQKFDTWLELFADDAYYWMPLSHNQPDPKHHTSLLYEDKLLLQIRIERLSGKRTFSQQPKSRCHHLLQAPRVQSMDPVAGLYVVRTAFHYTETRVDQQTLYVGWATHHLAQIGANLKIRLKRIDLVNCDAAFGNIQLFM